MALKGNKAPQAEETQTPTPSTSEAPKESKPRGPRIPKPSWGGSDEESYTRDKVLAEVLKGDEALIKTARSVASVLSKRPEFAGLVLTPDMVATRVKASVKAWETRNAKLEAAGKTPKPVPFWLKLDSARAKSVDLNAFEEDEE